MPLAIAVQIPRRRRWPSLVFAGLAAGALALTHWPAAEGDRIVGNVAGYVSLTGDDLDLAEVMRHPHWQVQLGRAWWSCMDRGFTDVYTITDGENLTWDAIGMPTRVLSLTDDERRLLRALPALSRAVPDDVRRASTYIASIGGLHVGEAGEGEMDGRRFSVASEAGAVIDSVVTAARARYVNARLAWLGDIRIILITPKRTRIPASALDPADLVDLADWALAPHAPPQRILDEDRHGYLLIEGHRVPIIVGDFTREPALAPLVRALQ